MFFNYVRSQILANNAMLAYQEHFKTKRETKMTREEAKKRVDTIGTGINDNEINKIFEVLEALGLIKFEKFVPLKSEQWCDCSVADICPQGKVGHAVRCKIWVKKF